MAKLRYSSGPVTVEMDDTLDRLVRRALDQAAPGLVAEIERETAEVHRLAVARWPVDSGRSKAGLRAETVVSDQSVRGRISNDVPYAFYVRPKFFHGSRTAWAEMVQKPMRAAQRRLVDKLGPVIRRALGRR